MKRILFSIILSAIWLAPLEAASVLIWNAGGKATTSANAISSALTANGHTPTIKTTISSENLSNYAYIFICLGVNPNTYVLSQTTNATEISNLINYLNAGGKVYMEGGDTWAWDPPTTLHAKFGISGEADGLGDLATITSSICGSERSSTYGVSQNYIDRLVPREGATIVFRNSNPAYACGIGYDNGTYRTIGVSFQFSGWSSSTRTALMADILNFFNNGCTMEKPAPLSVQAYSGYDGAVPLVWDAPPGQAALSVGGPSSLPSLLVGSQDDNVEQPSVRQRRGEGKITATAAEIPQTIAGYHVSSYNIYRATNQSGPYSLIASNVTKQYYRDETVSNGVPVYYKIKAVYDGVEGAFSPVASAVPSAGNAAVSPWKFITPVLDGNINTDEWNNAVSISTGGSTLHLFNDARYLYVAVDDASNTVLATDDQIGLYFDRNSDQRWGLSGLNEEGNYWLWRKSSADSLRFRGMKGWWPFDIEWDKNNKTASGVQGKISTAAGRVQYEMRIDLTAATLNVQPGNSLRVYFYSFDANSGQFTGNWPSTVRTALWKDAWMIPALFASLQLEARPAAPFIWDEETVSDPATVVFNEYGDGRRIEMQFSSVGTGGTVTVTQTNGTPPNPFNDKYVPCVWSLESTDLADFTTEAHFYYLDSDVASLNEAHLQVFRWSGDRWVIVGGVVNAEQNRIMVILDHFSDYALYEYVPIAVFLKSFTARPQKGTVVLEWQTESEGGRAGFNVFRSTSVDGEYRKINNELIPTAGSPASGAFYQYIDAAPENGNNYYKLQEVSLDGSVTMSDPISVLVTGVGEKQNAFPERFSLENYPNPFNPETRIAYTIPRREHVKLQVYDLNGRLIKQLVDADQEAGAYHAVWNGRDEEGKAVSSGIYILRLSTGSSALNKRMTLLR